MDLSGESWGEPESPNRLGINSPLQQSIIKAQQIQEGLNQKRFFEKASPLMNSMFESAKLVREPLVKFTVPNVALTQSTLIEAKSLRKTTDLAEAIDRTINRSLIYLPSSTVPSIIDLQSLADQQTLNMLNPAGSIRSMATSIAFSKYIFG